jgi:hypothetical protein
MRTLLLTCWPLAGFPSALAGVYELLRLANSDSRVGWGIRRRMNLPVIGRFVLLGLLLAGEVAAMAAAPVVLPAELVVLVRRRRRGEVIGPVPLPQPAGPRVVSSGS